MSESLPENPLSPMQRQALREAASHLRGPGAAVLLLGSGVERTAAAEMLAAHAGLAVYRIDLSSIISKYIGETEKNLDRVFEDARGRDVVLFLDEAGALRGGGGGVESPPSHLVQRRLEQHRGPVVLGAENRIGIDEAVLHRLSFVVELGSRGAPEAAGA
jgi:SpoVK/Ycf46/Vps4 family AAA+-type ATPase